MGWELHGGELGERRLRLYPRVRHVIEELRDHHISSLQPEGVGERVLVVWGAFVGGRRRGWVGVGVCGGSHRRGNVTKREKLSFA